MLYKARDIKPIPFQSFAPDGDQDAPGIILDATNAQPTLSGFRPIPNPLDLGNALPEAPVGLIYFAHYSDNTSRVFASTASAIWYLDVTSGDWIASASVQNISGIAVFAQFGDDVLLVGPGIGTTRRVYRAPNKSTTFSMIAGSPLNPATITVVSAQALAFADQSWHSCAAGDVTDWVPSVATLAATGILYDIPGEIVGSGFIYRNALAFKEDGAFLGQQSGPPSAWSWDVISQAAGTWGQGCIVRLPNGVAYLGTDDFYITTGYAPERIPNACKEWFFETVNPDQLSKTVGWYDALKSVVYWHFVSRDAADTMPDRFVSYNTRSKRWCTGHMRISAVSALGSGTARIATSQLTPCVLMNSSYVPQTLCDLTAGAGPMSLVTGYYGMQSHLTQLVRITPKFDSYPDSHYIEGFHSRELSKNEEPAGPLTFDPDTGWHHNTQYDRYHRFRFNTTGSCEISGLYPDFRIGGVR